ncbi:MAG: PPC domain-containing protein [Planctomycetaceae bacterium]|nr:PPC domain-containing protein [Planctomycetaceae bacterium]
MKQSQSILMLLFSGLSFFLTSSLRAEPPSASYIFPAGGQRGTKVDFKVGGHYLYDQANFEMQGAGISAPDRVQQTETLFFQGPFVPKPLSQQAEDYPRDYAGAVTIEADAAPGLRRWQVWNSQGITPFMPFVIGDLPEIVEEEIDGDPIPTAVTLPITINGRIFPREDVDIWTFSGNAGDIVHAEVMASRIGSPLDARLELRNASGLLIAENDDHHGADSFLKFELPEAGEYAIQITDVNYDGLQPYVYRLTLSTGPHLEAIYPLGGHADEETTFRLLGSNLPQETVKFTLPSNTLSPITYNPLREIGVTGSVALDVDQVSEFLEEQQSEAVTLPAVLNGRITQPAELDTWKLQLTAGEKVEFDLWAARLGSPLDSTLKLFDPEGKEVATADDITSGVTDSKLTYDVPATGIYSIQISDRFESRGGDYYAYRLKVKPVVEKADFSLQLANYVLPVDRGATGKLKVTATRTGSFSGPIRLLVENLPEQVSYETATIEEGKNEVELSFSAEESAPIARNAIRIRGEAEIEGTLISKLAEAKIEHVNESTETIYLTTTVPTPFELTTQFEQKFANRGSVYMRYYELVRNGFEGPVEISLADKQIRHKQGITGPKIIVPAGETKFAYPLQLSPFMEVGRTSRTNLVAVGTIVDPDGTEHKVSFTTFDVNVQVITLTDPGRLSLAAEISSVSIPPGKTTSIPIRIGRAIGLKGPVTVTLKLPAHVKGISADPIEIAAEETTGELVIQVEEGQVGPFNMPIMLEATMQDENDLKVIAQTELPFVLLDGY